CAAALAARGAVAVTVRAGSETGREGLAALVRTALAEAGPVGTVAASPTDTGTADSVDIGSGAGDVAGVLSLLALAEAPLLAGVPVVTAGLAGTVALVQALADTGVAA